MREIKFRVWDINEEEMIEPEKLAIHCNGELWHKYGYKMMKQTNYEEFELMQYTGLNDKNNVEIYEGDIINIHSKFYKGVVFLIDFDERRATFIFKDIGNIKGTFTVGCGNIIEVIGNIHENKDLLNS